MNITVMRATEHWQKAGAAYVRIAAMVSKYKIPLNVEFDDIDVDPNTRYIVLLDDGFPVATCRMFDNGDPTSIQFGRVIVIENYRHQGLGRRVIKEAEDWARELGYQKIHLDSRDVAVSFYEELGYTADYSRTHFDTFQCVYVEKILI